MAGKVFSHKIDFLKKENKMNQRNSWIFITVFALILSMVLRYQQRKLENDSPPPSSSSSTDYVYEDEFDSDGVKISSSENNNNNNNNKNNQVAHKSREAKMFALEHDRDILVRERLNPALDRLASASSRVNQIRSSQSWFPSSSEKAALSAAQSATDQARLQLVLVQEEEKALVAKLKPMYGLVSAEFFMEQRGAIRESLQTVSKIAYDNAWWHSLFNLGRAESLGDVILEFVLQYAIVYAFAYPFAFAYFALWFAPTTIYSYTESWADVPSALVMWAAWTFVMALPGIALYFGIKFLLKYLERQARENGGRGRHGQTFQQANRLFNNNQ